MNTDYTRSLTRLRGARYAITGELCDPVLERAFVAHSWPAVVARLRGAVAVVMVLVLAVSATELTVGSTAPWLGPVWAIRGFVVWSLGALAFKTSFEGPGPWLDRALVLCASAIAVSLGCAGWVRDVGLYAELLTVTLMVVTTYQWTPMRVSSASIPATLSSAIFLGGIFLGGDASAQEMLWCPIFLAGLHVVALYTGRAHGLLRRQAFVRLRLEQICRQVAEEEVAHREQVEEELVLARRDAEAANHAKSAFLGTISHELRTPLNGVVGLAEVLRRSKNLPESTQRAHLDSLHRAAQVLKSVVGDVLELSQIETGDMALQLKSFFAADIARDVAHVMGPSADVQNLILRCDVGGAGLVAQGDVARMRQVLLNFVGNALKFTARGEVMVSVLRAQDGGVRFEVRDTGPGIAMRHQEAVFERFFRIDDSRDAIPGTGLGLAISRELVEAMGGSIGVVSQLGVGSCFYVELPEGDPVVAQSQIPPDHIRSAGLDVVVADDQPVNLRVVEGLLKLLGHQVRTATDGQEALALIEARRPDLVLMDVAMPVMGGLEATTTLRSRGCDVPVVALTAHVLASDRLACLQAGMDAYLAKPVSLHGLADAIRTVVDESSQSTASRTSMSR